MAGLLDCHMDYADRTKSQIAQYADVEDMHAGLQAIEDYWKTKFVRPAFDNVFGAKHHFDFYFQNFRKAIAKTGNPHLVSLGSGDGAVEVEVAKLLSEAGVEFQFDLMELSPIQIERAQKKASDAGLLDHFRMFETDLNKWKPTEVYAGVMAHHSLHHVVELEHLFDGVRQSLSGSFCTMDMIGRNGHMRWPEALELLLLFWELLPADKRSHRTLKDFENGFINHDCSIEGFEGIRAQDILPCLVERFGFESFLGIGGFIDPFVDRGLGHHYDEREPWDRAFIDLAGTLNEILLDCRYITPTQMFAVMTTDMTAEPRIYRKRSPQSCIRGRVRPALEA